MGIHLKITYSLGEGSVQAEVRGTHGNRFFPFIMWFSGFKLTSGLAASIFTHYSILLENLFFSFSYMHLFILPSIREF